MDQIYATVHNSSNFPSLQLFEIPPELLHNVALQEPFAKSVLVQLLVSPYSSLPSDTILEKWNRRRANYVRQEMRQIAD